MSHVFMSYVQENREEVRKLADALRSGKVDVWLDRDSLEPGQRWKEEIRDAIERGMFFVACFSREYMSREQSYMNEELTLAIEQLRKRPTSRSWFIPVLLSGNEIPARSIGAGESLRDLQWVDLRADWQTGVAKLVKALGGMPPSVAARRGPSYKVCPDCQGSRQQRKKEYSSSVGFTYSNEMEDCSTCRGRGQVPSSMRKGFLGLRNLLDCWNCDRTGVAYNSFYTHCPACGVDLFP
jgi:hypothetical protein